MISFHQQTHISFVTSSVTHPWYRLILHTNDRPMKPDAFECQIDIRHESTQVYANRMRARSFAKQRMSFLSIHFDLGRVLLNIPLTTNDSFNYAELSNLTFNQQTSGVTLAIHFRVSPYLRIITVVLFLF